MSDISIMNERYQEKGRNSLSFYCIFLSFSLILKGFLDIMIVLVMSYWILFGRLPL